MSSNDTYFSLKIRILRYILHIVVQFYFFLEVKALKTAKKLKVKHGTLENLDDNMILIKDLESA